MDAPYVPTSLLLIYSVTVALSLSIGLWILGGLCLGVRMGYVAFICFNLDPARRIARPNSFLREALPCHLCWLCSFLMTRSIRVMSWRILVMFFLIWEKRFLVCWSSWSVFSHFWSISLSFSVRMYLRISFVGL